ncbi:adhesion G-protein coupled receptor G2-like isoform X2 [Kryptolebias marmoratus]|uniref:adhesion G-protein coupled receptor G2-like isoform X2 n=1 Tax=Kryptolebias marmoratus TaxID=37003 RepID=UPI0018ACE108|nr:adhesion G-protein coupled receptor G2-like isoform X2 [Kryptolebias marmoratus]
MSPSFFRLECHLHVFIPTKLVNFRHCALSSFHIKQELTNTQRMKFWVYLWLLMCFEFKSSSENQCPTEDSCLKDGGHWTTSCFRCADNDPNVELKMNAVNEAFKSRPDEIFTRIITLENVLEKTKVNETKTMCVENIVAAMHKHTGAFYGLSIFAKDPKMKPDDPLVSVYLPKELKVEDQDTVVFSMIHLPDEVALNSSHDLYDRRLFGLSVGGKTISHLPERINITINITTKRNDTPKPQCVFLNTSTNEFNTDGCLTHWDQDSITCSCDHLTYFGVLLVSASLPPVDQKIQSYITIIGCSISLFALVITVLIFITNKELRVDDSKKIHISLSVALILLNLHFLPSEAVAAMSSTEFCFYMALGLHYSLLATFSWMALEGLHLYLLLVKVFNIYIRRYLLKLSVVGWGVPAVIVSVVVIIDTDYYGYAPLDVSNPNGSAICYLTNCTVKMVTTVGVFALVFLFNVIMFGVIIKWFVAARSSREGGLNARNAAKKEICTVLSLMVLLGITWGLVFFSFGPLPTAGLYAFSILNSLQGFFIFIYFVLSWKKIKDERPSTEQSSKTQSTGTKT